MKSAPEYGVWLKMVRRCNDPKNKDYARYRGKLCEEWRQSFLKFFRHVGRRPSRLHTIDRINGRAGYRPGNVRWATRKEQATNRSSTILVDIGGVTTSLKDAARIVGCNYNAAIKRVKRGWTPQQALRAPSSKAKKKNHD